MKKDYYVQEEDGKLIVNTAVYREGNQYVHHARNGRSYDKLLVEPSKVYAIERYYRRNKSVPGRKLNMSLKCTILLCCLRLQ